MKHLFLLFSFSLLATTSLLAQDNQRVEAEVGGVPITTLDIKKRLILTNRYVANFLSSDPEVTKQQDIAWKNMRLQMVQEQLFLQYASKQEIKLSTKDRANIQRQLNAIVRKYGKRSTLEVALRLKGLELRDLRRALERRLLIRNLIFRTIGKHFFVRPQDMRRLYDRVEKIPPVSGPPENFYQRALFIPSTFKVRQIHFWYKKRSRDETLVVARKVEKAIKTKKATFADMALLHDDVKYSDRDRKLARKLLKAKKNTVENTKKLNALRKKGDYHRYLRDLLIEELREVGKRLKPGQVSEVVPTSNGYALLQVVVRTPNKMKSFYKVQKILEKIVQNEKYYKYLNRLRIKLEKETIIKIHGKKREKLTKEEDE